MRRWHPWTKSLRPPPPIRARPLRSSTRRFPALTMPLKGEEARRGYEGTRTGLFQGLGEELAVVNNPEIRKLAEDRKATLQATFG